MSEATAPAIVVENLRITLRGTDIDIVDDVSFEIAPGETVSLVGPCQARPRVRSCSVLLGFGDGEGEGEGDGEGAGVGASWARAVAPKDSDSRAAAARNRRSPPSDMRSSAESADRADWSRG